RAGLERRSIMPKSVGLTVQLIQMASQSILPAEHLDYDSLSYKRLETWESRVLASPGPSYIWTAIPVNLKRLRGSTSPVRVWIKRKFPEPLTAAERRELRRLFYNQFMASSYAGAFHQAPSQLLLPSQLQSSSSRRGLLGGVLGRLGF